MPLSGSSSLKRSFPAAVAGVAAMLLSVGSAAAVPAGAGHVAAVQHVDAGQGASVAAKRDGALVLSQLAGRADAASAVSDGSAAFYTYRGTRVVLQPRLDLLAVRVLGGADDAAAARAAAAAAVAGLKVADAQPLAAGYVLLMLAGPMADLSSVAAAIDTLTADGEVAFASPVFRTPLQPELWCFPSQEMLVGVDGSVLASGAAAAMLSPVGCTVIDDEFAGLPGTSRLAVRASSGFDVLRAANTLAGLGELGVVSAEPDFHQLVRQSVTPSDPLFAAQWHHRNTGQLPGAVVGVDLDTPAAWDTATGTGITVAVSDSGIQAGHPDINQVAGRDFTDGSSTGFGSGAAQSDCEIHATATAGIIAATWNNNRDTAGVAPGARARSLRWGSQAGVPCGSGTFTGQTAWLTSALAWSRSQGDRVTLSAFALGVPSRTLEDRYLASYLAGTINICSAGNTGGVSIDYPASVSGTVAVGAIDAAGVRAGFSSTGDGLDFVAPGVQILTADRTGPAGYTAGDTASITGTSAAAATVAGVAAVLVSGRAGAPAGEVVAAMYATARDLGPIDYDTQYGFGLPRAAAALSELRGSDDCAGAVVIGELPFADARSLADATLAASEPPACVAISRSVWYRWTAPAGAGAVVLSTAGSTADTVISVHSACSGTAAPLACNDDAAGSPQAVLMLVPQSGTTYFIRVATKAGASLPGTAIRLSIATPPPINDAFAAAIALPTETPSRTRGSTAAASFDAPFDELCGSSGGAPDVWYSITSACPRRLDVRTLGAGAGTFDTVLGLYQLTVDGPQYMACNDDCDLSRLSCLQFDAAGVATYLIRVSGFGGQTGDFDLAVSPLAISGNEPSTALPIDVVFPVALTPDCWTDSAGIPVPDAACATAGIFRDGWYVITPAIDVLLTASTSGADYDTVLAVYTADPQDPTNPAGLTPIACNNDAAGTPQAELSFQATAGVRYLIRVGSGTPASTGQGLLRLTATSTGPRCLADLAGAGGTGGPNEPPDGTVDGSDFIAFINSFSIGDAAVDPAADMAGAGDDGLSPDGTIDGSDFIAFINAFAVGC